MHPIKALLIAGVSFIALNIHAQNFVHDYSREYTPPKETDVLEKIDKWRDLKFGMIVHYGLYSHLGTAQSWGLCSDRPRRDSIIPYDEYKKLYWGMIHFFRPMDFNPEQWSAIGKKAGMKYLVFTTKHHDGFNMFDTKQSDFSITKGAFRTHPRRNITKEVFNAFRKDGYMIGAYYSKADWHSPYYWWNRYATPDRHVNYDIEANPDRWNKFKTFTYNQIEELMNGDYGAIDILWLDAGWVRPARKGDKEKAGAYYKGAEDIDMPKIAAMARSYQPGLIVVDRTVGGEYENYTTPEFRIPPTQLDHPWETNLTIGRAWGYVPGDNKKLKSSREVIHLLIEIVAKGGNFLLGIAPHPDGTIIPEVERILLNVGQWIDKNGKAIYATRNTANYNDSKTWFTQSKDGKTIYALHCLEQDKPLPKKIVWKGNTPKRGTTMTLISTNKSVNWRTLPNGDTEISLPANLPNDYPALTFAFTPAK